MADHVELPFEGIVSRRSDFDVPVAAQLACCAIVLATHTGRADVEVSFSDGGQILTIPLIVDPALTFDDLTEAVAGVIDDVSTATAIVIDESMLDHLDTVLEGVVVGGGGMLVGDVAVVSGAELALMEGWNATGVDWGAAETLVSLFAAAVDKWPDATAVVFEDRSLTYSELASAAGRIAARLSSLGVGKGSMVGVLCQRSVEMVAALYGVVTAGAAYVPLDPEYPPDRIGYMAAETEMTVVLGQAHLAGLVEDPAVTVIDIADVIASGADPQGNVEDSPDDVAYVIYTSGSTGRPKGVANSHAGVTNRLLWMQDQYRLSPGNVVLQKTPFSFDVSVWEFFWPLQTGARLVVAQPGGHRDPAYLIETINAHHVDTIHFVPSMLRLFLDHPAASTCHSLQRVICSGEALTRDLQDRFFATLPNAELHNLYGPTEAAIDVTAWQCRPDDTLPVVPIGAPIANTQIDILDTAMRPVPIGVPAELYIGGVQVAVGYVNRPDLTTERFIPDPHRPGQRLYKTGDLARWLPNGTIDFLGRLDHQVKIRGQRIELGEIEATLGEHPTILEATVVVRPDATGDDTLVAFLVPRSASAVDVAALRDHAKSLNHSGLIGGSRPWKRGWSYANGKVSREADYASVHRGGEGPGGQVGAPAATRARD